MEHSPLSPVLSPCSSGSGMSENSPKALSHPVHSDSGRDAALQKRLESITHFLKRKSPELLVPKDEPLDNGEIRDIYKVRYKDIARGFVDWASRQSYYKCDDDPSTFDITCRGDHSHSSSRKLGVQQHDFSVKAEDSNPSEQTYSNLSELTQENPDFLFRPNGNLYSNQSVKPEYSNPSVKPEYSNPSEHSASDVSVLTQASGDRLFRPERKLNEMLPALPSAFGQYPKITVLSPCNTANIVSKMSEDSPSPLSPPVHLNSDGDAAAPAAVIAGRSTNEAATSAHAEVAKQWSLYMNRIRPKMKCDYPSTKHVQSGDDDPSTFDVTYQGNQTCLSIDQLIRDVDDRREDGYFLSSDWLLGLEQKQRESLMSILSKSGYSETSHTGMTILFERIELDSQNGIDVNNPPSLVTKCNVCNKDREQVETPKKGDVLEGSDIDKMPGTATSHNLECLPEASGKTLIGSTQTPSAVNIGGLATEQGSLPGFYPLNQMNQKGRGLHGQTSMSGGANAMGSSVTGTMIPTPWIPQSPGQVQSCVGVSNTGVPGQIPTAPTAGTAPQPVPSFPRYTRLWEGVLAEQRKENDIVRAIPICKLEGYRQTSSSDTLAADWPSTIEIVRLMPQEYMNQRKDQRSAELLVFRPLPPHDFLVQLEEKKLCAVIQLPSQILLLESHEKSVRMTGMLFAGDLVQFTPQVSSQQQAASGAIAQAAVPNGFSQKQLPQNQLPNNQLPNQLPNQQPRSQMLQPGLQSGPTSLHGGDVPIAGRTRTVENSSHIYVTNPIAASAMVEDQLMNVSLEEKAPERCITNSTRGLSLEQQPIMYHSFLSTLKGSNQQSYAVNTSWISSLKDHEKTELETITWEAGYAKMHQDSNTTTFERSRDGVGLPPRNLCNNPTRTSDKTGVGISDTEQEASGTDGLLRNDKLKGKLDEADRKTEPVGFASTVEKSRSSGEDSPCHPQILKVTCSSLSQTSTMPSTSSSHCPLRHSRRQQFGDCIVTMPRKGESRTISTTMEKPLSMTTVDFSGGKNTCSEVCVTLKAIATTTIGCCIRFDQNPRKIRVKFGKLRGEVKRDGFKEQRCNALVLSSLRTNVYACINNEESEGESDEIVLKLEDEYFVPPRLRVIGDHVWLKNSEISPDNCESGSITLELQGDVRKRCKADLASQVQRAHVLHFQEPRPVVLEGDVPVALDPNLFLELNVRCQLEISYIKPCTPIQKEAKFVAGRRIIEVIDFDCSLDFMTKKFLFD